MIKEKYEQAAELHGHKCPGLAMGVRAAEEAKRLLDIESVNDKSFTCIAESCACYIDGIQALTHCTVGNGRLVFNKTGQAAFNFYYGATGESVRLMLNALPTGMSRQELIDYILTAPLKKIYSVGEPVFPAP